jgi:DNA-binding NarL/FixJ family response regulator
VVLADDHPIVREGLAAFFDERPELDFAITDLQLPKLHDLEVIQRLRDANSTSKLVILTINHDERMVVGASRGR